MRKHDIVRVIKGEYAGKLGQISWITICGAWVKIEPTRIAIHMRLDEIALEPRKLNLPDPDFPNFRGCIEACEALN